MKILVYGAGVIGTLYAARLQDGGNRVTVVARGQRLATSAAMVWRLKTSLVTVDRRRKSIRPSGLAPTINSMLR